MPTVPRNGKCATLGCKNPRARFSSYCTDHGGRDKWEAQRYNATPERKAFNDMYNTAQWRTHRATQLSRKPMCAACLTEGIVTPATTVDHVFPWAQYGKEAFYRNLFQSLCATHHATKTQLEQRGIFRHYTEVATDFNISDYDRVMG